MATASSSGEGSQWAVLLLAYGTPRTLKEVEPYLLDVRGGRATPPEFVRELKARYTAIGGTSPLLERTHAQAAAVSARLAGCASVYVGMRHWHPYVAEAMDRIRADGHARVVGIPLAPHYSRLSIGAYGRSMEEARGALDIRVVPGWWDHVGFLDAVAARVRDGLERFDAPDRVRLMFTAHSLPTRILAEGDPYPDQLRASVDEVMGRLGRSGARLAYQSAGRSAEPWLGPDAETVLRELAQAGDRQVLLCPIGFVSDHLEVLYDVDIELQSVARHLGVHLERTRSLNDDPSLMDALADLAQTAARRAGWT